MRVKTSQLHPVEHAIVKLITNIYEKYDESIYKVDIAKSKIYIAYSGGIDSSVLLYACKELNKKNILPNVTAWHINHNISPNADKWQEHCCLQCTKLKVKIKNSNSKILQDTQESIEIYARRCRYTIWQNELKKNDILLQAHHQKDQAETLMLRLIRNSPNLKGIPELRRLISGTYKKVTKEKHPTKTISNKKNTSHSGIVARPFLQLGKEAICDYAEYHQIAYVKDEMNWDISNDRSYIRHKILPPLNKKWQSATKNIAIATQRLDAYNQALPYAQKQLIREYTDTQEDNSLALKISAAELNPQLFEILIRCWVACIGRPLSPLPAVVIREIQKQIKSPQDKMPLIKWGTNEIRRYKNYIYVLRSLQIQNTSHRKNKTKLKLANNKTVNEIKLPLGKLILSRVNKLTNEDNNHSNKLGKEKTVIIAEQNTELLLGFRQGGEYIRLAPQGNRRKIKKLMQEKSILPWLREYIPLIYTIKDNKEELIAVPGIGPAKEYSPIKGLSAIKIIWQE